MNGRILYKDISDNIIEKIRSGIYQVGEFLPVQEELCEMYSTSLITIKKAMERVEQSGYIVRCRGRRAQVSKNAVLDINRKYKIVILDIVGRANEKVSLSKIKHRIISPVFDEWHSQIKKGIIENLPHDTDAVCATYHIDQIVNDYENTLLPYAERVVIVVGCSRTVVTFLQSKGKKVAAFEGDMSLKCCRVASNDQDISRMAVKYLISLGHKQIAFLGTTSRGGDFLSRYKGYQEAIMSAGIPLSGYLMRLCNISSADAGYADMNDILYSSVLYRRPTAVFCADDNLAYGALCAINESQLRCPEDISIIGVNNYVEICEHTIPPLSSIEKNFRLIGAKLAEVSQRREWIDDISYIKCDLVIRDSICEIEKH